MIDGEYTIGYKRFWKDPYGEPHDLNNPRCIWCHHPPERCQVCGEFIHNWYEELHTVPGGYQVILGEICGCGVLL